MQIINFILVYSVVFFAFKVFHFFFYICLWRQFLWWWYAGGKLWRHHVLLFIVYLKKLDPFWEIPKKRRRLRGRNSFSVAVEYWKVFAIHYQNIGVYNVLQTTFLLFLLFMHEMGFNIMQITTKWWRQKCPLAISSSP